jgi:hypothetical protein
MNESYQLQKKGKFGTIALAVGIAGLALSAVGYFVDADRFFHSYHTAFSYWVTLALGALFFTMLQHVTGAVWSVVVRRASEAMSMTLPWLFLFFVPVLLGAGKLFHWTHPDPADAVLARKAPYLNLGFFAVRAVVFFAIWTVLAWLLNKRSLAQDADGDGRHTLALRKISAAGMFLFAFSSTFAAFDWLMSIDAHWYSTIFGVYVFVGGFLVSMAFMTLFYLYLKSRGVLAETVTTEHYHDLGRFLFAFAVFWAYIGGSQYFLIWYANIPEETAWFLARWDARSWRLISQALIGLHFGVPFLVLAFYVAKRNLTVLKLIAALLMVMHYVDMYWLVMPVYMPYARPSWMDLTTVCGIGGIVLWLFYTRFAKHPVVPVRDPRLQDSAAHRV